MIFKNFFKYTIGFTILFCIILRISISDTPQQPISQDITPQVQPINTLALKKLNAQKKARQAYDAYVSTEDNDADKATLSEESTNNTTDQQNIQNPRILSKEDALGAAVNREREMQDERREEMLNDKILEEEMGSPPY